MEVAYPVSGVIVILFDLYTLPIGFGSLTIVRCNFGK